MENKQTLRPLLLFAALALLLPYFALCFFAHPTADDFDPFILKMTLPQWFNYYYTVWEGRYTAMVFTWLAGAHSLVLYRMIAGVIIVLTLSSAYFLISSLTGKAFSFIEKALAAILFTVLLLAMLPDLPQAIYWENGSLTYQLSSISALFYVGLLVRFLQNQFVISRPGHLLLCIILLFITIGFNEVIMIIILVSHALVWLSVPKAGKMRSVWLLLAICALLFSLIVILAPGNASRAGMFTNNHRLLNSLLMTGMQMFRFFFSWVAYAPLMLAGILFLGISNVLYEESSVFRRLAGFTWWQLFLFLWLVLFLCIFPAYWNLGILGQHRTLNVACCIFLLTWFLFIYVTAIKLGLKPGQAFLSGKAKYYIALLLAGCLLFSGNTGRALQEFSKGEITGFNNEMNARDEMVLQAKAEGKKDVSVPALHNKPSSLFVLDLQPDCKHWNNVNYAKYMGVDTVRLQPSLPKGGAE